MVELIKRNLLKISVILIALPAFIPATVAAQIDIQGSTCAGSNGRIVSNPSGKACDDINKNGAKTADRIVADVTNLLSSIVGILAVIMIIYAGFRYVTSGGSDDAVKGAKRTITYAIIGLVIVALAQIIVHFVLNKTATASFPCNNHHIQGGPANGDAC
jgi:amino acid transporter